MSAIFITAIIKGCGQYIKFDLNEQDEADFKEEFVDKFIEKALKVHDIVYETETIISFYDNNKTPVPSADLFEIVAQKINCGCFFIELKLSGDFYKTISAEKLKTYLTVKKGAQFIFDQHETTNMLMKGTRLKLLDYLCDLIDEEYGGEASRREIEMICRATIELFSSLKDKDGGIKMLYTGRSGFLYDKLRYKNKKNGRNDENDNAIDTDRLESADTTENIPFETDDENSAELMQFFKNCVVANDKEELKRKLAESIEFRRQILREPQKPIHEMFGFYFVDPELILYDFGLLFDDVNPNALVEIWPSIKNQPRDIHGVQIDSEVVIKSSDPDVISFVHFLKFLPARRVKLINALKAFIKFIEDPTADPIRLIEAQNPHPIIINLLAPNDSKYYIGWQNRIFSVPKQFKFIQVLDLYFKIHKVFDIEFEFKLAPMMTLIDRFIFNFPGGTMSITATIQNAANLLFPQQSN